MFLYCLANFLTQLGLGETGDFHLASVPLLETDGTALTQRKGKGEEAHDGGTSDALAAAPNIGFNFQPSKEKNTPAANGIPMLL